MISGDPASWAGQLTDFVPRILANVLEAWQALPAMQQDEREDQITIDLCIELRRTRDMRSLPFQVHAQQVELVPSKQSTRRGRLDLVFNMAVPDETVYFCLEAKRLNVVRGHTVRRYASEYVREGMSRFVTGQYAPKVRDGAMLACVFDGDVTAAIGLIDQNVAKRHIELRLSAPHSLQPSSVLPDDDRIRETRHAREALPSLFRLHHLFVVPTLVE